jgi:hypothetical protein
VCVRRLSGDLGERVRRVVIRWDEDNITRMGVIIGIWIVQYSTVRINVVVMVCYPLVTLLLAQVDRDR